MKPEERLYFSNVQDSEQWMTPNYGFIIIIPRRWWSIKDWGFLNDFIRHHQIYFHKETL